jgi:eukaryotic-like serine/threonine-protein kinase
VLRQDREGAPPARGPAAPGVPGGPGAAGAVGAAGALAAAGAAGAVGAVGAVGAAARSEAGPVDLDDSSEPEDEPRWSQADLAEPTGSAPAAPDGVAPNAGTGATAAHGAGAPEASTSGTRADRPTAGAAGGDEPDGGEAEQRSAGDHPAERAPATAEVDEAAARWGAPGAPAAPRTERWTPGRGGAERSDADERADAGPTTALPSWLPDSPPGATRVLGTYGGPGEPPPAEDSTQRIAPLPFGGPPPGPPGSAFGPAPGPLHEPVLAGGLPGERAPADRRRRTVAALVTAIGLLVVAVLGGVLLLSGLGPDGGPGSDGGGGEPSPSATAPAALPAGYTAYRGDGFTIGVPSGWKAQDGRDGVVDITEPGSDRRFLRLITVGGGSKPALKQLTDAEAQFAANEAYAPYEKLRLDNVDYRGYDAADWEFTFGEQRRHVLYRGVVVDGRTYGIYLSVPADRWAESKPAFQVAADTFRLTAGG